MNDSFSPAAAWPALRIDDWADTRDTLHMWTQVIGKIRMAKAPMVNHWWHVTLYVTPRGLSTSAIPDGNRTFEIGFDFCTHHLRIGLEGGKEVSFPLEPMSVAAFHRKTMDALERLGIVAEIWPVPVEVPEAIPFPTDTVHSSYDPDAARRFWLQLVQADRVMKRFRAGYAGKVSPVHFFWGAMDMAVTRFSGRPAPRHPGGSPNCPDWVMVEGYSHELSSAGFWPGGGDEGAFYAYAYPEAEGFRDAPAGPPGAFFSEEYGEFLLPYEVARESADPDATVLEFLEATYAAAADLGGWDRAALDYVPADGVPR